MNRHIYISNVEHFFDDRILAALIERDLNLFAFKKSRTRVGAENYSATCRAASAVAVIIENALGKAPIKTLQPGTGWATHPALVAPKNL